MFLTEYHVSSFTNLSKSSNFENIQNVLTIIRFWPCIMGGGGVQGEFWGILGNYFLGNSRKPGGLSQNSPKIPKILQNKISDCFDDYSFCFRSFHIHIPITY